MRLMKRTLRLVIPPRQLAAQEGGHVVGFHGMDGGAAKDLIKILERGGACEEDVGRIFDLHETPMVRHAQGLEDWTILRGEVVQCPKIGRAHV